MSPELLLKLDKTKLYTWDEVMDIAACISTQILIEFMMNDEVRKDIVYKMYNIKTVDKTNSRQRKKRSMST